MSFDKIWFFVWLSLLLGLAKPLDQAHRPSLKAAVESSTGASMDEVTELSR